MTVESIIGILGTAFVTILEKLSQSKLITHRGATVFHKSSEIEYVYHIKIGSLDSRPSGILKAIQNLINKPVEFDEIIEIFGYGLPHNESLMDLDIIRLNGTNAKVDFGKMMKTLRSDLVVIHVRKKFPESLKQKLVVPHMVQTSRYVGDYTETDMEIVLDYANLWKSDYDQFLVREIEFNFILEIRLESIITHLAKEQQKKIIKAAKSILAGNRNAIQYMKIMSDNFLTFEQDEKIRKLMNTVSVEPSEYFEIKSIIPRMQSCEIATVGYPLILPGAMKVVIYCKLDGKKITQNGMLRINLKEFGKILGSIIENVSKQTSNLPF